MKHFIVLVKKPKILFIFIVIVAALLRFYQLGINAPALSWDEVAWGYNAYTLGIDGKDEFGHFLPYTSFVSFGDYKPPVYAYLTVVPLWLFGLTSFAVRFPSAFFGTLTVLVTYFLVKELFGNREIKKKSSWNEVEMLALSTAFIMAVSPWHIMLSRAAFEANVATFFIVTGVWLFLYSMRKRSWLLILSVACFIISIYTFNSARIVAPLLFITLLLGNIKSLLRIKKTLVTALIVGIILLLPIVTFLISPEAKLRYAEVNIFSDLSIVTTANQEVANDHNAWWSKIIHNRRIAYSREFLKHYFDNFNPDFLFIKGDENPKFSMQDVGQLYLWDLPFIVIGTLFLFKKREGKWWIIPLWLLIGVIPAAVAKQTPHALRIESLLPMWQILTSYGFVTVVQSVKRQQKIVVSTIIFVLLIFIGYFLHGYYTHYPKEYSREWQYGYKEALAYVKANQNHYDSIFISDRLERGYIYTLFYFKYDPRIFRKEATIKANDYGFVHVDSFNKYYFAFDPATVPLHGKTLFIVGARQIPPHIKVLKKFYLLNGEPILAAYAQ